MEICRSLSCVGQLQRGQFHQLWLCTIMLVVITLHTSTTVPDIAFALGFRHYQLAVADQYLSARAGASAEHLFGGVQSRVAAGVRQAVLQIAVFRISPNALPLSVSSIV